MLETAVCGLVLNYTLSSLPRTVSNGGSRGKESYAAAELSINKKT